MLPWTFDSSDPNQPVALSALLDGGLFFQINERKYTNKVPRLNEPVASQMMPTASSKKIEAGLKG